MRFSIKKSLLFLFVFAFGIFFFQQSAYATHLRAGEITVERVSCNGLTFRITITVFTNTGSVIRFGEGLLEFGDGSTPFVTPIVENTARPDLGPEVATASFTIDHTYAGPGKFVISYLEPNRNAGILNMINSVETRFYIETVIIVDPFLGCSNSPRLLVPPIDKACTGATWFHNPGAFDPDGDSVSFEFTIPKREKDQFVNGYKDPNAPEFYSLIGLNFNTANEDQNGPPTFTINSQTGTITWDAPGAPGEYNIAFLIKEWRKIQGAWILLGYVTRDMQIIVEDCDNRRPELQVPMDICVEAGTIITEDIFGTDPDFDPVKIEAFSQVFSISPSPATFLPNPPDFQSVTPPNQAKQTFQWETRCEHVRDQPYQVVFKVTDDPSTGPKLVSFATWNITVVGPPPVWVDGQVDLATRSADLQWEPYVCSNAEIMQVWRRVDRFTFTPPECVTGMPDFLGFTKIAEVPIGTTTFKDTNGGKGLDVGAEYCYRLVAVFPTPGGGESIVSQDICLPPILADAPVVTNVSIDVTDETNGQITVKWRSPFDADKTQFPPPYTFEVFRAVGFSGSQQLIKPHPGRLTDSTFVDGGLNTFETVYNYRIVAFDNNGIRIDTSSVASSVRLEAASQLQQITLTWAASVPWSNQTQDFPRHLIFRGPAGATESQLVLIDSVDVNQGMFTYVDSGQFNGTPLVETEILCYRVMTRGAYGNPKIAEPLLNFSQIICAQPNDEEAPCTPELAIQAVNCAEFPMLNSCSLQTFSNTIQWKRPADPLCRADIKSYNVYAANRVGDPFFFLANLTDTIFVDANLPSFARCYRVSALDRSGNESELSEEFCFDNCPNYELPNVFTPNGDQCNEVFSAFSGRATVDESGNGPCGPIDEMAIRLQCARFVEKVNFQVFNRWGGEVFTFESGAEQSIFIDWDGRDNSGAELTEGVYFYTANVIFDVVDPAKKNKEIKGWVQIIK